MWYIIRIYTNKNVYIQYNIHRILSDSGAMGMTKGKRSIAGALNTNAKIKHLKSPVINFW
ncbi:hypothetical protein GCM10025878_07270 [Leuconostoc gasicomitatum]|nr:hypothetical protein GCM10025878_07270 [Leuconostoc gasicomitatum]